MANIKRLEEVAVPSTPEEIKHRYLRRFTNKAWKWMVDWVFENAPHEVYDELMSSREEYVKAMED